MEITSRTNPKIKYIRSLHQKKVREREKLILVEGTKLVNEAFKAQLKFHSLYTTAADLSDISANIPTYHLSPEVMAAASTLQSPPEYLAVVEPPQTAFVSDSEGLLLLTAELQDPGNFGALMRLAWALNLNGVAIWGKHVDIWHPKVIRGSMGAVFHVPLVSVETDDILALQKQGWCLVATQMQAVQQSFNFTFAPKTCLILGNEGQGLADELMALADQALRVPMQAGVDSLNVALTAAMLSHAYRQQYPGGLLYD